MDHIGKYEVIKRLGEGATSEVYLCHDPFNSRNVAVKVVFEERLGDTEGGKLTKKLFITEASLAGKLLHPHIVQIYDAVVDDKMNYIVMEYVAGGTLERFCDPAALMPIDKIVEIIFKCTRALDFAHKLGVTHRDIKPANILLSDETTIKISDFGAALMTTAEQTQVTGIGSPAYMSPQQIKEQPLDHQTDIYSLGVVMYQLLTGILPFQASNNFSMMYQITNVEPQLPSSLRKEIPPSLDRIVRKAMQKDLDRRYATWGEFSFDLAEAFRNERLAVPTQEVAETEKFNTMRALSFFADFTDAELWEVMRISAWDNLPQDTVIMTDGDTGDFFCILASGEIKVTKRKKLLNVLTPGECFGEMAYLARTGNERTADVSSMSASQVIKIKTEDLERASDGCRHRFDRAFMAILVERLTLANTRLTAI
ncbi:MAG: serine/threonine protein kinase [Betaproteobacteria bacterium RBG_16_64_18]|nr:MAG: serine/threonine protein kinase [Betaproteobacteria bacterium RBG_16_64_18]OGA43968.1 MAG: serine/threonine protein kinase [Betaproteobacteria bacterium RIFCSPLOWO2_12_FULL_65_110]